MKLAIILGTRPEIIKMSPIIRECERQKLDYFILHTGQHYSYQMDSIFFKELELPEAKYNLNVGSGLHGEQTGKMLTGIEEILLKESPKIVLVEGDTNTVLAGALAAAKLHIAVGHVEAGLRSGDRNMAEELNRILSDHVSDYLFAPTGKAKENLLKEGIEATKIFITGNTIVDAVYYNMGLAETKANALDSLDLRKESFLVLTLHRAENVDVKDRLKGILAGLELAYNLLHLPIVFPVHPRTKGRIEEFGLVIPIGIKFVSPLGVLEFLQLIRNARLVLTDSGGVQEEACILRVPCVTLRDNTERPETVEVGANVLSGCEPDRILVCADHMLSAKRDWENPFGDGTAAKRIIDIIGA